MTATQQRTRRRTATATPKPERAPDTPVTIQEMYELTARLVRLGHGDKPIFITYEGVFGTAYRLREHTRVKYHAGVYVGY